MLRILQVMGAMVVSGAETMLMNYYRHIDRERVQFDFVVHTAEEQPYDREIMDLGGKIYHTERFRGNNYLSYRRWWRDFFREHPEYTIVHGHIGSSAAIYLHEAKRQGRYAIAHSHNTYAESHVTAKGLMRRVVFYPTRYVADYFFGCSQEAGQERFGRRVADSERFSIMMNAIDCKRFAFSEEKRAQTRAKYGLGDAFVVGHVGRFTPQKNHERLVDIFARIHEREPSARLLCVGEGSLRPQIEAKLCALGLEDAAVFAGVQFATEDYYAAMDAFLFPSLFEGLGIVLVEAQANGLMCVTTDMVPSLADIGAGLFRQLHLTDGNETWADAVLACKEREHKREASQVAIESGWEIAVAAPKVQMFYERIAEQRQGAERP